MLTQLGVSTCNLPREKIVSNISNNKIDDFYNWVKYHNGKFDDFCESMIKYLAVSGLPSNRFYYVIDKNNRHEINAKIAYALSINNINLIQYTEHAMIAIDENGDILGSLDGYLSGGRCDVVTHSTKMINVIKEVLNE